WGFGLGLIATAALYGAYAWIAVSAVRRVITLGQMTMYVALFRQGQAAVSAMLAAVGGMYEDNLYLSTLYEYLETNVPAPDDSALRERIGVIFQDFARYQMLVGENVGAGDERFFEDEERWHTAAVKGRASEFIETLPAGYRTQLGKWFRDGRELSGGQWQKIALSRAFMRIRA